MSLFFRALVISKKSSLKSRPKQYGVDIVCIFQRTNLFKLKGSLRKQLDCENSTDICKIFLGPVFQSSKQRKTKPILFQYASLISTLLIYRSDINHHPVLSNARLITRLQKVILSDSRSRKRYVLKLIESYYKNYLVTV